jgi:tetratricopeptide (TPR) repeat protein
MKILGVLACLFILNAVCMADDASTYYDKLGSKLYSTRNYTEALDYFNKSLVQNRSNVDAWVNKGNTLKALSKLNDSIDAYEEGLKIDARKSAAWSGLADAWMAKKDYANASVAAGKATEFDLNNKGFLLREGNIHQLQGMFKEAEVKYDRAIAMDPNYKDALYRKGLSELDANNTTEAIAIFDQIIAMDPKYKQAFNAKGQALESQGKYTGALVAYDRALQIDPKWNLAMTNKMHALLALGKHKEAMDIFMKI